MTVIFAIHFPPPLLILHFASPWNRYHTSLSVTLSQPPSPHTILSFPSPSNPPSPPQTTLSFPSPSDPPSPPLHCTALPLTTGGRMHPASHRHGSHSRSRLHGTYVYAQHDLQVRIVRNAILIEWSSKSRGACTD